MADQTKMSKKEEILVIESYLGPIDVVPTTIHKNSRVGFRGQPDTLSRTGNDSVLEEIKTGILKNIWNR